MEKTLKTPIKAIETAVIMIFLLLFITPAVHTDDHSDLTALRQGDAAVWYLFHAGWAMMTEHAFLIYDYVGQPPAPKDSSLFDGLINKKTIEDKEIYIIVSHRHGDHYDPSIWKWKKVFPNITYIFGWDIKRNDNSENFGKKREIRQIGRLKIKNIFHNFDQIPESAFLIEVDGLVIYFSGDHGNFDGKLNPIYKDNINYIASQSDRFDLAFLSIFGSRTYDGELYALQMLKPNILLPMHFGGYETEAKRFASFARTKTHNTLIWFPLGQKDGFLYKNNKILPMYKDLRHKHSLCSHKLIEGKKEEKLGIN